MILLALLLSTTVLASLREDVDAALERVQRLEMMDGGKEYTLPVGAGKVTGPKEAFLRRRTPEEILASGLSSGCGDYAMSFYGLMREKRAELLFIDAAELSAASFLNRSNGHTGVAVKDPATKRWLLTDPTSGRLLSQDWDPASTIYRAMGGRFWIFFSGRLEDYPIKGPDELNAVYDRTLRAVPAQVWKEELIKLDFAAPALSNPRAKMFLKAYAGVLEELGVQPWRKVAVTLQDGGPDAVSDCLRSGLGALVCEIGLESAMSSSLLGAIERDASNALR